MYLDVEQVGWGTWLGAPHWQATCALALGSAFQAGRKMGGDHGFDSPFVMKFTTHQPSRSLAIQLLIICPISETLSFQASPGSSMFFFLVNKNTSCGNLFSISKENFNDDWLTDGKNGKNWCTFSDVGKSHGLANMAFDFPFQRALLFRIEVWKS